MAATAATAVLACAASVTLCSATIAAAADIEGSGKRVSLIEQPASQTIKWKAAAAGREEEGMDVGREGKGRAIQRQ